MKISFRTEDNAGSAYHLLDEMCSGGGDTLFLSSGYMTAAHELPINQLLFGCARIILVIGHWSGTRRFGMLRKLVVFRRHLVSQSNEYGIAVPEIDSYVVPHWHAKIAIKHDAGSRRSTAAVIGSSNVSEPALALSPQVFNIECDVLIKDDDGPDARIEIEMLFEQIEALLLQHKPIRLWPKRP